VYKEQVIRTRGKEGERRKKKERNGEKNEEAINFPQPVTLVAFACCYSKSFSWIRLMQLKRNPFFISSFIPFFFFA
jgi:hypothetical protein